MEIQEKIKKEIIQVFEDEFNYKCSIDNINIDQTPKNFDGLYTLILFPHLKHLKENLNEVGKKIGDALINKSEIISSYNQVKGFLNFDIKTEYLLDVFKSILNQKKLKEVSKKNKEIIVEFSSPNTNKPLHLGHLRNIFLGDSISKIYEELGYKVHKVQIINDRGIHICLSLIHI